MKVLLYVDVDSLETLDELLEKGVDDRSVDEYLALTVDGAPLVYDESQKAGADHYNHMALACMGLTDWANR